MRVALITGANGFCGRHLARRLEAEGGFRVLGAGLRDYACDSECLAEYIQADLCDPNRVDDVVKKTQPDIVFNLVGLAQGKPAYLFRSNFFSALYLLEALRQHSPNARALVVGSAAEYGTAVSDQLPLTEGSPCAPTENYGASKHAMTLVAQNYAQFYRMKIVVARPFNIIGAGIPSTLLVGAVLSRIKQALRNGGEPVIKIGNLESERDFVAVGDVVEAYIRMMAGSFWGEIFNLCSGQPRSVRSVIDLLLRYSDRPIRLEVDASLLRSSDQKRIYGDWGKAKRAIGYEPSVPIEEALHDAWKYAIQG
ncbi:MAG: NAD-dependent epimerase/dehydratase family protein [Candidatus Acidiferrum sp.]